MIGCHDVEAARLELAGGGALSPAQSEAIAQHVAGCPACQAFAQELDAIEAMLRESLAADAERATGGHAARFLEAVAQQPARPPRVGGASRRLASRPATAAFPFRATGAVALAAGLLLAAGVGLFEPTPSAPTGPLQLARQSEQRAYVPGEPLRAGDGVEAVSGASQPLTLPQAELRLAAGSALKVDRVTPRSVTLLRGAVACDVVPNSGAFELRTQLGVVHVVGTRFQVLLGQGLMQVVVERGKVEVASLSSGERVPVAAGQSAELDGAGRVRVLGEAEVAPAPSPAETFTPDFQTPDPQTPVNGADRVFAKLVDAEGGALFDVRGSAPWLPDGTSLHVNLTTPGMNKELRVAFFKVVVAQGSYAGSFHWPHKRFAPLVYTATVDLYVSNQPPSLRRQLMTDLGYAAEAQIRVSSTKVEHGTQAERDEHARQSLDHVEALLERGRQLITRGQQVPGPDVPGRAGALSRFQGMVSHEQQALRDFTDKFVVLREDDLLHELRNVVGDTLQIVEAGGELESQRYRLEAVSREIATRRPHDFKLPDQD